MKNPGMIVAALLVLTAIAPVPGAPVAGSSPGAPPLSSVRDQPILNFTYLVQDGSGSGSTAFKVDDGSLTLFFEAFPAEACCSYKPAAVDKADIIFEEPHGHNTHYDPDSTALVAKNTGAYVVGNAQLKSDMLARGVDSKKLVELTPSLGQNLTTTVLGVSITAFAMTHTSSPLTTVDTWVIGMPNGVRFFHGTCAASSSVLNYMAGHWEFYDLDMMMMDYEHSVATLNSTFTPEKIIIDHRGPLVGYNNSAILYESPPGGGSYMVHNTTYKYTMPDYQPLLTGDSLSPTEGEASTYFIYGINYTYRPDRPPTRSQVVIDGSARVMAPEASSGWRNGVPFKLNTSLSAGNHSHYFDFEVDGKAVRYPASGVLTGPSVNAPPVLSSGGFMPAGGDTDTNFTFFVNYQDANNDSPRVRAAVIDGSSFVMDANQTDYAAGANFSVTMGLGVGQHKYHFLFNDTKTIVRFPKSGELDGPTVVRAEYRPILSEDMLSKASGIRSDRFEWRITYADRNNDAPSYARVVIDGKPFVMTTDMPAYVAGAVFTYSTGLSLGNHSYHYEFSDGVFQLRLPAEEGIELSGPEVLNQQPRAVVKAPKSGTSYNTTNYIQFDSNGSSDPDGDQLNLSWSSDLDGPLGDGPMIETLLSEGQHNITLNVSDGYGGSASARIRLTVVKLRPRLAFNVTLATKSPMERLDVKLKASVTNSGEAAAYDVVVNFTLDGADSPVKSERINIIDIGGERSVVCTISGTAGKHTMVVSVTGLEDEEFDFTVQARNPPKAVATFQAASGSVSEAKVGESVTFDGSRSTSSGTIDAYAWEFGDGTKGSGVSAQHSYPVKGSYTVKLTVTDDYGKEANQSIVVIVVVKPVVVAPAGPNMMLIGGSALAVVVIAILVAVMLLRRRKPPVAVLPPPSPAPPPPPAILTAPADLGIYRLANAPAPAARAAPPAVVRHEPATVPDAELAAAHPAYPQAGPALPMPGEAMEAEPVTESMDEAPVADIVPPGPLPPPPPGQAPPQQPPD